MPKGANAYTLCLFVKVRYVGGPQRRCEMLACLKKIKESSGPPIRCRLIYSLVSKRDLRDCSYKDTEYFKSKGRE